MKWPCPASEPTCLAPASGAAESQGILRPRGVAALLRGAAKGRVGPAQQRSSCLDQASLPSLLPTTPSQVSVPTQTTGTTNLLKGTGICCPASFPHLEKNPHPSSAPVHTPCHHRSHQFCQVALKLQARASEELEAGDGGTTLGQWESAAGASLPQGLGRW